MVPIISPSAQKVRIEQEKDKRSLSVIFTGLRGKCPACEKGKLYSRYLKVVDKCSNCGEELFHHRADDAPPYFTIFIVGHLIVGGVLLCEKMFAPEVWVHMTLWIPLTIVLSLWLLPLVKGALVGLQWALRMHGFGTDNDQFNE
ncbi:MAG: DUF983 domain-containing protein [Hyphomicrobium sp.]